MKTVPPLHHRRNVDQRRVATPHRTALLWAITASRASDRYTPQERRAFDLALARVRYTLRLPRYTLEPPGYFSAARPRARAAHHPVRAAGLRSNDDDGSAPPALAEGGR
jgi:hypothetical protein